MFVKADLDEKEMIRRYQAGESSNAIGKDMGVSGRTILNRLKELGIPRRYCIKLDVQEIVHRYKNGESTAEIARSCGVSDNTILNRLNAAGLELCPGPDRKYDDAEVCRMYLSGMDISEIQARTGAKNCSTFYDILRRNGVQVRLQRNRLNCPEIRQEIISYHLQGLSHVAIAKIVKVNRNYIGEMLQEEVEVPRKRWQPKVSVSVGMSLKQMRDDKGLTIDEISEITGLSRVEVFEKLQEES